MEGERAREGDARHTGGVLSVIQSCKFKHRLRPHTRFHCQRRPSRHQSPKNGDGSQSVTAPKWEAHLQPALVTPTVEVRFTDAKQLFFFLSLKLDVSRGYTKQCTQCGWNLRKTNHV